MSDEDLEPSSGVTRRDIIVKGARRQTTDDEWIGETIQYEPGKYGTIVDMTEDKLLLRARIVVPKGHLLAPEG